MFIDIKKRQIKIPQLPVLVALLFIAFIVVLKLWDPLVAHRFMPEPKPSANNWESILAPFKPAKKGYSVLVDLDNLVLNLYEDAVIIKSWSVSGGSKENPSPTGSWTVTGVGNWGEGFGGSWIALNVPWGKYGIHGTMEPWAVGSSNISHGCIRMENKDVAELKQYISIGIPVYIKYDDVPFRALKDGKIGSDVLKLQVMLKRLGYYMETPDGRFGAGTFKALCQFQADEKIKVDGIVGRHTWNLLHELVAKLKK